MWEVEKIPNTDSLYYRIHINWMDNEDIMPGVFRERGTGEKKGMSCDWSKHSTPEDSRKRAQQPHKNGIIEFIVQKLRELNLTVNHAPIQNHSFMDDNRAHSNVKGVEERSTEIRLKLLDIYTWKIKP